MVKKSNEKKIKKKKKFTKNFYCGWSITPTGILFSYIYIIYTY